MLDYMTASITIAPGIYKEGSQLAAKGRFVDGNNVRFYNGFAEKIGGFQMLTASLLAEPSRACTQWLANDGTRLMAWGTPNHLYVWTPDTLYDITPAGLPAGNVSSAVGISGGWGDAAWGDGYWGGAAYAQRLPATVWYLAPWGQDLIAVCRNNSGSTVYWWQYANGFSTVAQPTGGTTPTDAIGLVVSTLTRTAIVLGQLSLPLRITWANQTVLNDWVASDTNTAGNFDLSLGSQIVGATQIPNGYLVLTDLAAYAMIYSGTPYTFSTTFASTNCGLIGPHAAATLDSTAVWWGTNHFHSYNGVVSTLPCEVENYVFGNLNLQEAYKITCGTNTRKGEVIWFYPSVNSSEPDSYVALNLRDNALPWSIGTIGRGSYMDIGSASSYPIGVDSAGMIWQHEIGTDAGTAALPYSLTTGELEFDAARPYMFDNGKSLYRARKLVPNMARLSGTHSVTLTTKNYPSETGEAKGPFTLTPSTTKLSVFGRGRSMELGLSASGVGTDFRMGLWRAEIIREGDAA